VLLLGRDLDICPWDQPDAVRGVARRPDKVIVG